MFYEVIHTLEGRAFSQVVQARNTLDAQETFIDECEARGEIHGTIVTIRRVTPLSDGFGVFYVPVELVN